MLRIQLPYGCYGIEMPNGEKYDANHQGGYVDVPDRHGKEIASSTVGRYGILSTAQGQGFASVQSSSRVCPTCKFVGWRWQTRCPRDGSTLEEEVHG